MHSMVGGQRRPPTVQAAGSAWHGGSHFQTGPAPGTVLGAANERSGLLAGARHELFATAAGAKAEFMATATEGKNFLRASNFHVRSVVALIGAPWLVFVTVLLFYALPPNGWIWKVLAALVFCGGQALAAISITIYVTSHKGPIYLYLGLLCALATTSAWLCGVQVFEVDMVHFWTHYGGDRYANVAPTRPADSLQDASIIHFTATTRLDLRRVLGFRSQEGDDTTYCVAPILDETQDAKVQFWAAGKNCCEPTRSYLCDEAMNPSARSGLILKGRGSFAAQKQYENFRLAAAQASAIHGFQIPEEPLFLLWHQDPESWEHQSLRRAVMDVVLLSLMYLVVSGFLAGWLHLSSSFPRN